MAVLLAVVTVYMTFATSSSLSQRQEQLSSANAAIGFGAGNLPFSGQADADEDIFASAGRTPNASTAAKFQFGYPTEDRSDTTWFWRINLTNVEVAEDSYAANLQFDLQWPGGGTLQSYLGAQDNISTSITQPEQPLCAASYSWVYLPNVTSRYSSSDNGNCSNILGVECAASLFEAFRRGTGSCQRRSTRLQGLAGCEDTFDAPSFGGGGRLELGNSTWSLRNANNESLQSGDATYHVTFSPLPGSNLSNYEEAGRRFNMLHLSGGGSLEPVLLCQVLEPPTTSSAPNFHIRANVVGIWAWILVLVAVLSL